MLCIECGYDVRTRRQHKTVDVPGEEETETGPAKREPKHRKERLPAGFARVRLGLGFHSVRLALQLLAFFVVMALIGYLLIYRPRVADNVLI